MKKEERNRADLLVGRARGAGLDTLLMRVASSSRPLCAAHRCEERQGGLPASPSGTTLPASMWSLPAAGCSRQMLCWEWAGPGCKWMEKDLLINLSISKCPSSSHRGFKTIHKNSYNTVITK